jgi:hypothetical protein
MGPDWDAIETQNSRYEFWKTDGFHGSPLYVKREGSRHAAHESGIG